MHEHAGQRRIEPGLAGCFGFEDLLDGLELAEVVAAAD
jgi:hypothetical protein